MVPLILLVVLFVLLVIPLGWLTVLRMGLAGMFFLTASAHWGRRRADLVRMVPKNFPHSQFLVTLTGICEIMGAIGLLSPPFARWAAIGLTLLLIGVFPANVSAARGDHDRRQARHTLGCPKRDAGYFSDGDDSRCDRIK